MMKAAAETAKAEASAEMKKAAGLNARSELLAEQVSSLRDDLAKANATATTSWQTGYQAGMADGRKEVLQNVSRMAPGFGLQ